MKGRKHFIIFLIVVLCFTGGCIHTRPVKMYPGSKQPSHNTARIAGTKVTLSGVEILSIDGKDVPSIRHLFYIVNLVTFFIITQIYEEYIILPGYHELTASYYESSGEVTIKGSEVSIPFYADAGHSYIVREELDYDNNIWRPVIHDITKMNGQGTITYPDGAQYVGEWKNDQRNGQGTITYPDGTQYVGEWKNDQMNGEGTYTWPSGTQYVGEWKNDQMNGEGTYTWPDGAQYVGEWKNDQMNGEGTHTWPDGKVIKGLWENGEFVKALSEKDMP